MAVGKYPIRIVMETVNLALTKPHFKTTIFKSFIEYLSKHHPDVNIRSIVESTGLSFEYFLKEDNWVSVEVERAFVQACYNSTKDPDLSFNVGKTALAKENIGAMTHQFAKHVVPIKEFFDRLPKMTAIVNRVVSVQVIRASKNVVNIEYTINRTVVSEKEYKLLIQSFPSILENIRGYFHAIADLKKLKLARVEYQIEHRSDGSPIARFVVAYSGAQQWSIWAQLGFGAVGGSSAAGIANLFSMSFATWKVFSLITFGSWFVSVLRSYMTLSSVAKETEKSLEKLDNQYSELHRAKLLVSEQLRESRLINEVSSTFIDLNDEESILKSSCESVIANVGFDRVVVLMHDEQSNSLKYVVSAGKKSDMLKKLFTGFNLSLNASGVSDDAITSVYKTGRSILISDVEQYVAQLTEERSRLVLKHSESTGFACVPVSTAYSKVGVIIADTFESSVELNDDKLRVLKLVANQMAIFIEKQRAKQSLIKAYEAEVELAKAHARFVPMETLRLLNYQSVLDVRIGDGVEKEMTVMFSDLRDFTSLCETMSPEEVLRFLNSYYSRLSPIIKANNGIIDKFIGDGLMAIFGDFRDAVNASLEMQRELVKYNLERRVGGRTVLSAGIGIAKGQVIFGPLGADGRMQLTALSDTVNLASRLDGLCSQNDAQIIVSGSLLSELPQNKNLRIKRYEKVAVKGKSKQVDAIEIIDPSQLIIETKELLNPMQIEFLEKSKLRLNTKVEDSVELIDVVFEKAS